MKKSILFYVLMACTSVLFSAEAMAQSASVNNDSFDDEPRLADYRGPIFSVGPQMASVVGFSYYGSYIGADLRAGYRFRKFSLGLGAAPSYATFVDDCDDDFDEDEEEDCFLCPIYGFARVDFMTRKVSPVLALCIGGQASSDESARNPYVVVQAGCRVAVGRYAVTPNVILGGSVGLVAGIGCNFEF